MVRACGHACRLRCVVQSRKSETAEATAISADMDATPHPSIVVVVVLTVVVVVDRVVVDVCRMTHSP